MSSLDAYLLATDKIKDQARIKAAACMRAYREALKHGDQDMAREALRQARQWQEKSTQSYCD